MASNLLNQKFGKLLVIERTTNDKNRNSRWLCQCECGQKKEVLGLTLVSGKATTCGCLTRNIGTLVSYRCLMNTYKCAARKTRRNFLLTEEQFISLVNSPCHYCGIPYFSTFNTYLTKNGKRNKFQPNGKVTQKYMNSITIKYNGIDRKDNQIGYIFSNCLSCCKTCNFAKKAMPYNDFMAWIKRLIEFNKVDNRTK